MSKPISETEDFIANLKRQLEAFHATLKEGRKGAVSLQDKLDYEAALRHVRKTSVALSPCTYVEREGFYAK